MWVFFQLNIILGDSDYIWKELDKELELWKHSNIQKQKETLGT